MSQQSSGHFKIVTVVLGLSIVLVSSVVFYRHFNIFNDDSPPRHVSDDAAAQPFQAPPTLDALEAAARSTPGDVEAWRRLGLARYDARHFAEAARAYETASRLAPKDAALWSALGEARVMASAHDPMPAAASAAFTRALELDAGDPRARYFDAVRQDLAGDHEGAIASWLALLADTPPGAPWRADLVRTIEQVGKINAIPVAQRLSAIAPPAPAAGAMGAIPGPSPAQLAQARAIRPEEQRAMAQDMVARLEARLAGDPGNVEGWVMLMRSRLTLGEPDKAARALTDARAANPSRADYLEEQARRLGLR
ncbi:tetratricopeptide repeat protein [Novosphingobium profundi]|uniref:tetratricopeptide repeat protein n=1 Tax=Novosphingobium profundi TaxID=1774954 RepID=UPI001BD9D49A|nr:tetratricopeptide repeat protein [Novosphingobium profundi]MBT0670971.1 tetratricopeptide repeat protein [Novosphingobium profundi]